MGVVGEGLGYPPSNYINEPLSDLRGRNMSWYHGRGRGGAKKSGRG